MSVIRFLGHYEDRVAAELAEGYVVGTCTDDCVIAHGAHLSGVLRSIGEQRWTDEHGNAVKVIVEDFDLDGAGLRNWSTGVE